MAYYEAKERPAATKNLISAISAAQIFIIQTPERGVAAPRAYPKLKRLELSWVLKQNYWFSYRISSPPIIVGVYYASSDIPNRI